MENVLKTSNKIWDAMTRKDIALLQELIQPNAMFVHMSRSLSRDEELDVIKEDDIVYKVIDVEKNSIHDMGTTIVLLNKLNLTAVVKGNEVTNPFVVTEVYTKNGDELKLASLSFTKVTY